MVEKENIYWPKEIGEVFQESWLCSKQLNVV